MWWNWAPQLTNDLLILWPWLREAEWKAVAAVLGSRLGPDWTAEALARFVTDRNGRAILMTPAAPVAYLKRLLDRALLGNVVPPCPARLHTEHVRGLSAAVGAAQLARQAEGRTEAVGGAVAVADAQSGPGLAELGRVWTTTADAKTARLDREARRRAERQAQAEEDARRRLAELAEAETPAELETDRWQRQYAADTATITTEEILGWIFGPAGDLGGNG